MFDLDRFLSAQLNDYDQALKEIERGRKSSHWIWYIFPQLKGIGKSDYSYIYGIDDLEEAKEYYNNQILRDRLIQITESLLKHSDMNIKDIVGEDAKKIRSCMTLFFYATNNQLFKHVVDVFFKGQMCEKTEMMLKVRK